MRKTILALLLVLLGTAWADPAPVVNLTFWHAMHGVRGRAVRSLVDRFNQANPDIHVDERFVGADSQTYGNDYHALYQSILEHIAQRSPPDVAQVYENWTTQLMEVNAIAPVDQFIKGPDPMPDVDDIVPVFRDANTFNGHLCTLPFNKSVYVLYYNQSLVLKAPRTLAELQTVAKDVAKRHPGTWGLTFEPGVDIFGDLLYANGGTFFDSQNRAAFAQEPGVTALSTLLSMTRTDRSAAPSLEAQKMFTSGKAAMYIWSSTAQVEMRQDAHFPIGVAMVPMGTTRAYQFAGTNLAILAPLERQKAAWRFVRFMTSTDSTMDFAMHTGYLPVRWSAIHSKVYQAFLQRNPGFEAALQALPYARIQPRLAAWESVRGILDDAVFAALSGNAEPQDALTKAASQADDLIQKLLGKP